MSGTLGGATYSLDVDLGGFSRSVDTAEGQARDLVTTLQSTGRAADGAFKPLETAAQHAADSLRQLADTHTEVTVNANVDAAEARLSEVRSIVASVSDAKAIVNVNAQTEAAHAELTALREQLNQLGNKPEVIEVKAQVDTAISQLNELRAVAEKVDAENVNISASAGGASGALSGLGRTALGVASGIGIANTATNLLSSAFGLVVDGAIGMNSTLETTELQFTTLLGSADEAHQHVADLFDFAANTPFETQPIIDASRELETLTQGALDTKEELTLLGNASAATGSDITEVAFNVAQVYAALQGGTPFGEYSRRLVEIGAITPDVVKQMADMQAAGASIADIMGVMNDSLERFTGSMDDQAHTWQGLVSSAKDFIRLGIAKVFQSTFEKAEAALSSFVDRAQSGEFDDQIDQWSEQVAGLSDDFATFVKDTGPDLARSMRDLAEAISKVTIQGAQLADGVAHLVKPFIDARNAAKDLLDTLHLLGVAGFIEDWFNPIKRAEFGIQVLHGIGDAIGLTGDEADDANPSISAYIDLIDKLTNQPTGPREERGAAIIRTEDIRTAADFTTQMDFLAQKSRDAMQAQLALAQSVDNFDTILLTIAPNLRDAGLSLSDEFVTGISKGFTTAAKVITEFTTSGKVSFQQWSDEMADLGQELSDNLAKALAGGDPQAIAAAQSQMDAFNALMSEGAARATEFAGALDPVITAYQGIEGAAAAASATMDIWNQKANDISKAMDLLKDELDAGRISQEQYDQENGVLTQGLERAKGGILDNANAFIEAQNQSIAYTNQLDALNAALGDGSITQQQYDQAVHDLSAAYDPAIGAQENMTQSMRLLAEAMDTTIERVVRLLVEIGAIDGLQAKAILGVDIEDAVDGTADARNAVSDFASGEYRAKLDADNRSALSSTGEATAQIDTFIGGNYQAKISADNAEAITAAKDAEAAAQGFASGSSAGGGGHKDTGTGTAYSASIGAEIGNVEANLATAYSITNDYTTGKHEATITANEAEVETAVGIAANSLSGLVNAYYLVTVHADTSEVDAAAAHTAGMLYGHSPTKEGPLSEEPNWGWLFEGIGPAAEEHGEYGADAIDDYLPHSAAKKGPFRRQPSWDFLFEGIDASAEDHLEQMTKVFSDTLGDLHDLATGATAKKLQQDIADLVTLRDVAQELGFDDLVAEYNKQIAEKQHELEFVGAVMATDVIQGYQDTIEAADLAAKFIEGLKSDIGTISLDDITSGDFLTGLTDHVHDLELERQALIELGVPAEALVELDAEIADGYRQIKLAGDLLGTDTVKDIIAVTKAEQDAAEAAENWRDAIESVANDPAAGFTGLQDQIDLVKREMLLALESGNIDLYNTLQKQYYDLLAQQSAFYDTLADAFALGLVDEDTLKMLAEQGGEEFRAWYDGIFGEGALEKLEAGWNDLAAVPVDVLASVLPTLSDHGISLIDTLVQQAEDGERSWEEVWALYAQIADQTWEDAEGNIVHGGEEARKEFEKLLQEAQQHYAELLLTDADAAAEYKKQLDILNAEYEQLYGVTMENVTAAQAFHDALHDISTGATDAGEAMFKFGYQSAKAFELAGQAFTGIGKTGGLKVAPPPPPEDPTLNSTLSLLAGFPTDVQHLTDIIESLAGGDLAKTFADEQVGLLSEVFSNPDLYPPAFVEYVKKGLGETISDLGVGLDAQLEQVNKLLADAGLKQLTADEWADLNKSWQTDMLDTATSQAEALADLSRLTGDGIERQIHSIDAGAGSIVRRLDKLSDDLVKAVNAGPGGSDLGFDPFGPGGLGKGGPPTADFGAASGTEAPAASADEIAAATVAAFDGVGLYMDSKPVGQLVAPHVGQSLYSAGNLKPRLIQPIRPTGGH